MSTSAQTVVAAARDKTMDAVRALPRHFRQAAWNAFEHGAFACAKAAAYSSMLTLFPALLLVAALLANMQNSEAFVQEIATALGRILPPGSDTTAIGYFHQGQHRSMRILISASSVSVLAASGVMISWMEGFRKAYVMKKRWGFWKERGIAILLMIFTILPMSFATVLVAFGAEVENWIELHSYRFIGPAIALSWIMLRWLIALVTSISVISLIYHHGVPRTQPWHKVLPGAVLATGMWFAATMIFGWYVTNYATYSLIYGSIGATIALLVWMYMNSLIVLLGAEFNALVCPRCDEEAVAKA